MRIVYMGTPEFAVPCLEMLLSESDKYNVVCVVTKPDMPKGRKYIMTPPPVKEVAQKAGIPVLQPTSVRTAEFVEELKSYEPDLFITCAYGKILPQAVLDIPKMGCINVHASLLPAYRGSAPLWHVVINGEKETGITTMMTDIGMDTGDILLADKFTIEENMTMGEVHDALSPLGAQTLKKTLEQLVSGTLERTHQDNEKATYSPPIDRETGKIDWSKSSREIHNLVRGTNPFPVSYSFNENGEKVKIWQTLVTDIKRPSNKNPGDVIESSSKGIYVVTGDGVIQIIEIQGASGKKMKAGDYVNGHTIEKFT